MASQIQLLINGIDYAPFIDLESINVDNNIIMTSDSASFTLNLNGERPRPRSGHEFIWRTIDTVTGQELTREFGGVIVNVTEEIDGITLVYNVTVKSYDHWFNRHLVVAWYNEDYADVIVRNMVQQFCPGFTTNNVRPCPARVVPQYFNYSKPTDAIKNIADQLEWGFYIDYYRDVHFYPAESLDSPLPAGMLDAEKDIQYYGDLVLSENGEQVYNRIFLRGFKTRSQGYMNLTFLGDGSTAQWSLGYRASSVSGDVKVAIFNSMSDYQADTIFQTTGTATMGTQLTVKRDIIDGAPDQPQGSGTAYIHYTQHLLRVPSWDGSGNPPASGKVVAAHFYYMKDVVYMGQDLEAQTELAAIEGTDGIYEYSHEDKSLTNSTIAAPRAKAQLMILKYGRPQIRGSFISFLSGWRAGQTFTLISQNRMGGLNKQMYVHRVSKKLIRNANGNYVVQNTVEFADSPYLV